MKLCIVSRQGPADGAEAPVVRSALALTQAGHEVWLLTDPPQAEASRRLQSKALPAFHQIVAIADGGPSYFHAKAAYARAMRIHQALAASGQRFDLVWFADRPADAAVVIAEQTALGAYAHTAVAVGLWGADLQRLLEQAPHWQPDADDWEAQLLDEGTLQQAPVCMLAWQHDRDRLVQALGVDPARVVVVAAPDAAASIPVEEPPATVNDFVYLGRLQPDTALDDILRHFELRPDLRLWIDGEDTATSPFGGSYRQWLAPRLPANVQIVDGASSPLPDGSWIALVPAHDPHAADHCQRAMLRAALTLAERCEALGELLAGGASGGLLDGSDRASWSLLLDRAAKDAAWRQELGARGRAAALARASTEALLAGVEHACEIGLPRPRPTAESDEAGLPMVSIVVPLATSAHALDAAVDSALGQQDAQVEVLLIDEGVALWGGPEALLRQAAKGERVRILRKDREGLASARNFGVANAAGEFVLLLDPMDTLRPDAVATAIAALQRCPGAGFAVCNVRFHRDDLGEEFGVYNPLPFRTELALVRNCFGESGACFRRSIFAEQGLRFDEGLDAVSQWALWVDLHRAGQHGVLVPRELVDHRIRKDVVADKDSWRGLHQAAGQLIERHFPELPRAQRAMLHALHHSWGRLAHEEEMRRRTCGVFVGEQEALLLAVESHKRELAVAQAQRQGLLESSAAAQAQQERLQAEVEVLRAKVEWTNKELAGALARRDTLAEELAKAKAALADKQQRIEEQQSRAAELQQRLDQSYEHHKGTLRHRDTLQQQVATLNARLEEAAAALAKLRAEGKAASKEADAARAELVAAHKAELEEAAQAARLAQDRLRTELQTRIAALEEQRAALQRDLAAQLQGRKEQVGRHAEAMQRLEAERARLEAQVQRLEAWWLRRLAGWSGIKVLPKSRESAS